MPSRKVTHGEEKGAPHPYHNLIVTNIAYLFESLRRDGQLLGGQNHMDYLYVFTHKQAVPSFSRDHKYRMPDVLVAYGCGEYDKGTKCAKCTQPRLVVEVLSQSNQGTEEICSDYRQNGQISEVWLVHTDTKKVERLQRTADNTFSSKQFTKGNHQMNSSILKVGAGQFENIIATCYDRISL